MSNRPILVFCEGISHCHIIRPLVIAKWLRELGHEVIIASPERSLEIFLKEGFRVIEIPIGDTLRMYNRLAKGYRMHRLDEIFFDADYRVIYETNPCLVVVEFRPSAFAIAKKMDLPTVSLTSSSCHPNFDRKFSVPDCFAQKGPRGFFVNNIALKIPGLDSLLEKILLEYHSKPLHRAYKKYALPPLPHFYDYMCQGDLCLISDHPEIMPIPTLRESDVFCGPIRWQRDDTFDESLLKRESEQALVYISVGTQESLKTEFLEEYAQRVASSGAKIIVSKGGREWNAKVSHPNLTFVDFINEDKLLPNVDLFVFHGGTMSMYQAMFSGVPMIALPAMSDQHYHAEAIRRLGVGDYFRPSYVKIDELVDLTFRFLADEMLSGKAKAMQKKVMEFDAKQEVLNRVSALIESSSPRRQAV